MPEADFGSKIFSIFFYSSLAMYPIGRYNIAKKRGEGIKKKAPPTEKERSI
ncbi:MAG: hypothetical protein LKE88_11785 [Acidaminococcus provencensis]|uniref:hypothetical protein n=1 Tax=Acidaminococcus provencensis TaxID=2058289 RepID=UPI0023F2A55B|nr:hypothetical protein [Acidaminococcus provencensis]MCH4097296.1 hypothetical protein [Acidaminococcus provencensis]